MQRMMDVGDMRRFLLKQFELPPRAFIIPRGAWQLGEGTDDPPPLTAGATQKRGLMSLLEWRAECESHTANQGFSSAGQLPVPTALRARWAQTHGFLLCQSVFLCKNTHIE